MGSCASGRHRTRNRGAVERSLRLDIRLLRRRGLVRPGVRTSGSTTWNMRGDPCGSIGFAIDLTNPDQAFAELRFSANGVPRSQTVQIDSVPCRFGGRRFYFRCPNTWRRCEVLCGVGGHFASREFHRLTYHSQSEERLDRLRRAEQKAEARLFGKDGHPRPRGAHRERLAERWCDLHDAWQSELATFAARRWGMGV